MIDGALLIKTLLSANWNSANTNSRTPSFSEFYEQKKVNPYDNTDEVLVYDRVTDESPTSLGNGARQVVYRVSVDLRTDYSKNHCLLMYNEVKRIIRANVNYTVPGSVTYGTSGQQVMIEKKSTQHFSNSAESKLHKNFRKVIELELTSFNEAVS